MLTNHYISLFLKTNYYLLIYLSRIQPSIYNIFIYILFEHNQSALSQTP